MKLPDILQELEHLAQVPSLRGERYAKCLETYEGASDQRERILDWVESDLIPEFSMEHTRILSVGCGAGDLDKEILAAGARHSSMLSYVGLEPDPRQCAHFISRMESDSPRSVRVAAHNTRFEDFDEDQRFDLVLLVHSLYYMEDPARAVEKARGLVGDEGRLAILIASNDTLNELSSSFWELERDGPTWFSEDLSGHLEKRGVPFERKRIQAKLDVTACCEPDSERGVRIADFLAQVRTSELPARLRRMIFAYLDGTSRREGQRRWLPHNVDAFTIGACRAAPGVCSATAHPD